MQPVRDTRGMHGVVVRHRVVPALNGDEERAHAVGADAERGAHAVPFEQCPAEGGECVAARELIGTGHRAMRRGEALHGVRWCRRATHDALWRPRGTGR